MNANTDKTLNSSTDHLHEALRKATPAKLAAAIELLRKEPVAKRYPLPGSVSDLVENDIRDAAFELLAITRAIFSWSTEQKALPIGGGILDMDTGDIVTLSDMAIRRAQRIVDLANEFDSKVTYLEVNA